MEKREKIQQKVQSKYTEITEKKSQQKTKRVTVWSEPVVLLAKIPPSRGNAWDRTRTLARGANCARVSGRVLLGGRRFRGAARSGDWFLAGRCRDAIAEAGRCWDAIVAAERRWNAEVALGWDANCWSMARGSRWNSAVA